MVDDKKDEAPAGTRCSGNLMWIGTLNNPEIVFAEEYLEAWKQKPDCAFVTGQFEKGKNGTEHIQYFLHFTQ